MIYPASRLFSMEWSMIGNMYILAFTKVLRLQYSNLP